MGSEGKASRFRTVGDGSGIAQDETFYREEVQLGLRNHGMPLEGLRYPITPTGMHYLLVHFDIPYVGATDWRLEVGGLVSKPLSLTLEDIRKRPAVTMPGSVTSKTRRAESSRASSPTRARLSTPKISRVRG